MEKFNFCPSCGHKIDGSPNYCPECGKPLTNMPTKNSPNLLKNIAIKFKESNTTAELISNFRSKQKKISNRREGRIIALNNPNAKEYIVTKIDVHYGNPIIASNVIQVINRVLILTNKSISFYEKGLFYNKKQPSKLSLRIDLSDIKIIYKEKSIFTYVVRYHIVTSDKEHIVIIPNEPYRFVKGLLSVATIEGNLYNIDLLPDERIIDIANGTIKQGLFKIRGTLYYSNKRIIFNKLSYFDSRRGEGTEVVFNIDRNKISSITENKQQLNCNYIITSTQGEYSFSFAGLAPKSFLSLVPGAEGNKDVLERKRKVGKILKVASFAASFIGIGEFVSDAVDIDTGDMDIDTGEDYANDMDATAVDFDGDGYADAIEIDTNGDGQVDAVIADTDGDGVMDSFMADKDGDGNVDMVGTDTDGDGTFDKIAYDTNGDGNLDTIEMDSDGDGVIDMAGADTNGDGIVDTDVSVENSDSSVSDNNDGTDSMIQDYNDAQSRVMELNREIQNTADPLQREALIRERDNIINHAPSPADIMLNR